MSEIKPEPMLLTVAEVAELLSISPRSVWRLIKLGKLASVKPLDSTRVRRSDLEAFVAGLEPVRPA